MEEMSSGLDRISIDDWFDEIDVIDETLNHLLIDQPRLIWYWLANYLSLGDLCRLQATCHRMQERINLLGLIPFKEKELPTRRLDRWRVTTLTTYIIWLYQAQIQLLPITIVTNMRKFKDDLNQLCYYLRYGMSYRVRHHLCLQWKWSQLRNNWQPYNHLYEHYSKNKEDDLTALLNHTFTLRKYVFQTWKGDDRYHLNDSDFESADPEHIWLQGISNDPTDDENSDEDSESQHTQFITNYLASRAVRTDHFHLQPLQLGVTGTIIIN